MKFSPKEPLRGARLLAYTPLVCLFVAGMLGRSEPNDWVQNIEGSGRLEAVFFKKYPMPGGDVSLRRTPSESRTVLDGLLAGSPTDAELLLMRARLDEEQLDFTAAEADWKKRVQSLQEAEGELELADFYHRRLRSIDELRALGAVARSRSPASDQLLPASRQRSWLAFERMLSLISAQALPSRLANDAYRSWVERYPKEPAVYSRFLEFLAGQKKFESAGRLVLRYESAFPQDKIFPVEARAWLKYRQGTPEEALGLYDQAFQPLWPPDLVEAYFSLLRETHHLRDFLGRARAGVSTRPQDLTAASRLFYYYQQQGNLAEAQRALFEYRGRMESSHVQWTAEQLWTLGQLFEGAHNYNEAARSYYALYSLTGAGAAYAEKSLGGIINLLFSAPEQRIAFGTEDLTLLHDIGTLDADPGFLNGVFSLLLNSQQPAIHEAQVERASVAYFHRVRAAELLPLFDSRFARSPNRPELHSKLIEVYATYGATEGVTREARQFLAAFPRAPQRVHVALLLADALAKTNRVNEELGVYDQLLADLASRARHVPLGEEDGPGQNYRSSAVYLNAPQATEPDQEPTAEESQPAAAAVLVPRTFVRVNAAGGPRSAEYASVLERYIARLVALKRPLQVLALFKREMERNPHDPGLYQRLALFLDQNRLGDEVESVYRQAISHFPDRDWYERLARWYLRRRRASEFEQLSRKAVGIFKGADLQHYFESVVASQSLDAQLYLQLNLYAHTRFPHNLAFVRNLLAAYSQPATANMPAWLALIRQHWYYTDDLRSRYFAYLSASGRLDAELANIRRVTAGPSGGQWDQLAGSNPAAAEFLAQAEIWRSHFEVAAPLARALAAAFPADTATALRASSLCRSLAAFDPAYRTAAAGIEESELRYSPRNEQTLTRFGEIYADGERFDIARPYWNRIADLEPGRAEGYLNAATIFWDYFRFDDALRLMHAGRRKLAQPALFAYEAGAVYEGKRDYARAVAEYMQGALVALADQSPARKRLIELARRPRTRPLVEQATASLASGANPEWNAASLKIGILEAFNRRDDVEKLLLALAENASRLEFLERVDRVAEQRGYDAVHNRCLERRVALATDSVERLSLQLQQMRFAESRGNLEQARHLIESIYGENSRILGVVRATVDFYWRNKSRDEAIETLLGASKVAYPALSSQFAFEAGRKATDAREYQRAREVLGPLIGADPMNAEYLAAMADTYAREGNDAGLRDFILAQIRVFSKAPLSTDERNQRIAALRRGLIPALTRLKDYPGAVAQYIEILNRYPEDEGLAQEAADYAERHGQREQILKYYDRAASDSPRDYRWPMIVARLETFFEDYPAAIAAYTKARQVRPDRLDFLSGREALEERLMQFNEAIESTARLYDLSYQDPQWMLKTAELRMRLGNTDGALQALRRAEIEGRPERPEIFFDVAARLVNWNLLQPARDFAQRGVVLAGHQLLTDADEIEGSKIYAEVFTRLRHYDQAFATLLKAAEAARAARFSPDLQPALVAMAQSVRKYFTPEERVGFADFLERQKTRMSEQELQSVLLPLAQQAGLAELEARWRFELMMARPGSPQAQAQEAELVQLQTRRMLFDELGEQLEKYWNAYPNVTGKDMILEQAAAAYRGSGNSEAELGALSRAFAHQGLSGAALARYLDLLLAREPQQLASIAGSRESAAVRDAAANTAVAAGDARLASQVIRERGRGLPPVWRHAYTGLVGLYYGDPASQVDAAYLSALGSGTIGERIGRTVDRLQQLAGNIWFYYGSRYGEYRSLIKRGGAEDYLSAMLEGAPASAGAYATIGDYYQDRGDLDHALADYAHALELDAKRGAVHDRIAVVLWQQGKHDDAVERWQAAFHAFLNEENSGRLPTDFWEDLRTTLDHVGARKLLPEVRGDADRVLRTDVRRNGAYQVNDLIRAVMTGTADPGLGVAWILELAESAPDPLSFLSATLEGASIPLPQQGPVLQRIVQLAEEKLSQAHGTEQGIAMETLRNWQVRWVSYLLDARRTAEAEKAFNAVPEEDRAQRAQQFVPLAIRLAAQSGTLSTLLGQYQQQAETAPPMPVLQQAAAALERAGDGKSAGHVLEFAYARQIQQHDLTPANFLALAEIRLQSGDLAHAVDLLRRMTLAAGQPFENLSSAATLLTRDDHPSEAMEFLSARVKAVPWDAQARLELAKAGIAAARDHDSSRELLVSVAASPEVPYAVRAEAAQTLARLKVVHASLGSHELDLLGSPELPDAAAAELPGLFYARLAAAGNVRDPATRVRLLLGAIATEPQDESPRIALFRAALQAGRTELADSALEPLLSPVFNYRYQTSYRTSYAPQTMSEEEQEQAYRPEPETQEFLPGLQLNAAEKSMLAGQLADVLEKLHRPRDAVKYWSVAIALASDEASRREFQERRTKVEAAVKLEQQDSSRRPLVTEHLEQKVIVRPRVINSGFQVSASAGEAQ